jgi:hypothetical protein
MRRWRELVIDRKNGEVLFDRPKPRVGCSANGRRRKSSSKYSKAGLNIFCITNVYRTARHT